jgi:hypothetical protein
MATTKISKHISYKEGTNSNTAVRKGIKNEPNEKQLKAMKALAKKVFEPLRIHFNEPIRINSFFRSTALNKAIGGSTSSQHCKGEAVDLDATKEVTNKQLYNYIKDNLEFDQLIWEFGTDNNPNWVHVSYKSTGKNRKQLLKATRKGRKAVYTVVGTVKEDEKAGNSTKKGVVAVNTSLNVRETASIKANIVGKLKNGKKITIVAEKKGWYQLKTSRFSGWVSSKYINLN